MRSDWHPDDVSAAAHEAAPTKPGDWADCIAVVGMAGRFPGARNIDDYWKNLCDGVESIRRFSEAELREAGVPAELLARDDYVRVRPVLDDVESFDAGFFGYTPREAALIDPQQRLFLECAWQALEHAGHDPRRYPGWIGVYGGVGGPVYAFTNLGRSIDMSMAIANAADYVATRVSYKLDLKGPSFTVQAACATSLLAVHTACQGLLDHQCDMALAGGASIDLPQASGYLYEPGGIRSPDGHCRAFDADAQGTVFGNGAGVVVLKRMDDALSDGDTIYAVIRGSATNNDGAGKAGYTAPGVDGQAQVIALAQRRAQVEPQTIGYVEAHGTGTALGDPIEMAALTQAFRARTPQKQFCLIGSVKPNIGHVDTAAGVAGLIKTVLALHHRRIPPTLHFKRPNPRIAFADSPFRVVTALTDWTARPGVPRRAAVSSFGIGGTNVHAILEEAPAPAAAPVPAASDLPDATPPWQVLTVSARSAAALDIATRELAAHLNRYPASDLADVAFTLLVGRRRWTHRRTVVCRDAAQAVAALQTPDPACVADAVDERDKRHVVFMFPGQGSQHHGMAWPLYRQEPLFRTHVDQGSALLRPLLGLDLRPLMFPLDDSPPDADEQLQQTRLAQPALFLVEYALARCWMEWGVQPQALIGHSVGELVAACLAGVFSLEDALTLVAARGRLMQQRPPGAMLAVALAAADLQPLLQDGLALAAVNAPSRCTVAGPAPAMARLEKALASRGVPVQRLRTSHAFHSPMMVPALAPFVQEVQRVRLAPPRLPCVSNLTGTWLTAEQATSPDYWARQLLNTVRFADGLRELMSLPDALVLEVGPGQVLGNLVRQWPEAAAALTPVSSLPHAQDRSALGDASIVNAFAALWRAGVHVEAAGLHAGRRRRRVPLPSYPFERQRYWIDAQAPSDAAAQFTGYPASPAARTPGRQPDIADWFYLPVWRPTLPPAPATAPAAATRWLVFADGCGLGAAVADQLRRQGHEVAWVTAGESFAQQGEGGALSFAIDPQHPADYAALLGALQEANAWPQFILHLWNVTPAPLQRNGPQAFQDAQPLGFDSLLNLAHALGRQGETAALRIQVVSTGMQQVSEGELREPEKATLLGPCRTLPREYPHISCQSIDVALPGDDAALRALARRLVDECATPATHDTLAYRGRQRWVQAFEPLRVGEAGPAFPGLREQGVYLVTGGLGAIGLVVAQALAQAVKARLVLLGRTALPPRAQWSEWLAEQGDEHPASRTLRQLLALEALGAEILVVAADIADEGRMREVVASVRTRFGALHGVFHCAGIAGGGLMQLKTLAQAREVFAPKVQAMHVLETVLADNPPDFMLLCSSTLSFMGEVGQVDYCAANAFLDAYAHHNTACRGVPTLSVNWEGWLQAGMAAAAFDRMGSTPLQHPLFSHRVNEASQATYYVFKLGAAHWLFAEHRIRGLPTLPGTAHIDMARAAWLLQTAASGVELQDVYFLAPLMLHPGEAPEIRLELRPGPRGSHEFRVLGRAGAQANWQAYSRGTLRPLADAATTANAATPTPTPTSAPTSPTAPLRDLAAIRAQCSGGQVDARALARQAMEDGQDHWGPRWHQSFGQVLLGERQALALLELQPEFRGDCDLFGLHPALLDVATAIGLPAMAGAEADAAYLPLSYERIEVHGPLPPRLYSHVRCCPDTAAGQDMLPFDVTLLDEQGRVLVDITRYTLRRVGDTPAAEPGPAAAGGPATAEPERGIYPHEGAEVLRRLLSRETFPFAQVVVSSPDLHRAIEAARRHADDATLLETIAQRHGPAHARPALETVYVAPATPLERQLAGIWQEVLGVDEVGLHDDYFELGGDSLTALLVISRVRSVLQVQLAPHQLFEQPTVAGLAKQVAGATLKTQTPAGRVEPDGRSFSKSLLVPSLAPWQGAADAVPLFCLHPIGGQLHHYHDLARHLGEHQPVHGIQSPEMAGLPWRHADVGAMAAAYAGAITLCQPAGPCRLLGWSSGGVIAMAVAAELERQGRAVDYVGLIDSQPVRACASDQELFLASAVVILASVRGEALGPDELRSLYLDERSKLEALYDENRALVLPYLLRRQFQRDVDSETLDSLAGQLDTVRHHMALLAGFLPARFKAPVHMVLGNDSSPQQPPYDWSRLSASAGGRTDLVDGGHYSMLQGANARRTAEAIRSFINRNAP